MSYRTLDIEDDMTFEDLSAKIEATGIPGGVCEIRRTKNGIKAILWSVHPELVVKLAQMLGVPPLLVGERRTVHLTFWQWFLRKFHAHDWELVKREEYEWRPRYEEKTDRGPAGVFVSLEERCKVCGRTEFRKVQKL